MCLDDTLTHVLSTLMARFNNISLFIALDGQVSQHSCYCPFHPRITLVCVFCLNSGSLKDRSEGYEVVL